MCVLCLISLVITKERVELRKTKNAMENKQTPNRYVTACKRVVVNILFDRVATGPWTMGFRDATKKLVIRNYFMVALCGKRLFCRALVLYLLVGEQAATYDFQHPRV